MFPCQNFRLLTLTILVMVLTCCSSSSSSSSLIAADSAWMISRLGFDMSVGSSSDFVASLQVLVCVCVYVLCSKRSKGKLTNIRL